MNVEKGDLAIAIKARLPENLGSIYEVIEFIGNHNGASDVWLLQASRPFRGLLVSGQIALATKALVPDAWLKPVSGIPDTDTTDTERPIKEIA